MISSDEMPACGRTVQIYWGMLSHTKNKHSAGRCCDFPEDVCEGQTHLAISLDNDCSSGSLIIQKSQQLQIHQQKSLCNFPLWTYLMQEKNLTSDSLHFLWIIMYFYLKQKKWAKFMFLLWTKPNYRSNKQQKTKWRVEICHTNIGSQFCLRSKRVCRTTITCNKKVSNVFFFLYSAAFCISHPVTKEVFLLSWRFPPDFPKLQSPQNNWK